MAAYQYIYVMKGLNKAYPGGKQVLKDIWLSFFPGAKIGVLGLNGAGKSTLLRVMAGQDDNFTGEAWAAEGAKVGMLEQEPKLDAQKDVLGNVMDGAGEMATMLARFEEVSNAFSDPDADMDKLIAEQAELQEKIDNANGWDLQRTVDIKNTIITHDAGSPRDQLSPFWKSVEPLSYIGWGKTTQLGYGLGLAMGAKLAKPDKLCINVWGDAAIGFTGMDFETAVRERIPIMSILLNNFSMAIELKVMPISTEKYRSTDISGDYAAMARAFGGYGERVTKPEDIIPAIKRGIQKTKEGVPVLLEFITSKETEVSRPGT